MRSRAARRMIPRAGGAWANRSPSAWKTTREARRPKPGFPKTKQEGVCGKKTGWWPRWDLGVWV